MREEWNGPEICTREERLGTTWILSPPRPLHASRRRRLSGVSFTSIASVAPGTSSFEDVRICFTRLLYMLQQGRLATSLSDRARLVCQPARGSVSGMYLPYTADKIPSSVNAPLTTHSKVCALDAA